MKFLSLLVLTSCASGYHSYADGKWHDNNTQCRDGFVYDGQYCTKTITTTVPSPSIYLINSLSPKSDALSQNAGTSEGNDEESAISALMKKVMIKKAMQQINSYEPKVKFGDTKFSGVVELGRAEVNMGIEE
jgi:hypothetical protein